MHHRRSLAAALALLTSCAPIEGEVTAGGEDLVVSSEIPVTSDTSGLVAWDQSALGVAYLSSPDQYVVAFADDRFHDDAGGNDLAQVRIARVTWGGVRLDGTERVLPITGAIASGDLACGPTVCALVYAPSPSTNGLWALRFSALDGSAIDTSPVMLAGGSVRAPHVDWNATRFVVVAEIGAAGAGDVSMGALPASGGVTLPVLSAVAATSADEREPRIACGASDGCTLSYTVAGSGTRLVGIASGAATAGSTPASMAGELVQDIAYAGGGAFVAATVDIYGQLRARRITSSGATRVVSSAVIALGTPDGDSTATVSCTPNATCLMSTSVGGWRYGTRMPVLLTSYVRYLIYRDGSLHGIVASDPYGYHVTLVEERQGARNLVTTVLAPGATTPSAPSDVTLARTDQTRPRVAAAPGTGFGVAWITGESGRADLVMRLFDAYGAPTTIEIAIQRSVWNSAPISIGSCSWGLDPRTPDVAFDGAGYVVVWQQQDGCGVVSIWGARIGLDGKVVVPPTPLTSDIPGGAILPAVACTAGSGCLLAYRKLGSGTLDARPIAVGPYALTRGAPLTLSTTAEAYMPRLAASSRGYEVVWSALAGLTVRTMGVSVTGVPIAGSELALGSGAAPEIACIGERCDVAWQSDLSAVPVVSVRARSGGIWSAARTTSSATLPTVGTLAGGFELSFVRPTTSVDPMRGRVFVAKITNDGAIGPVASITGGPDDAHAVFGGDAGHGAMLAWDRLFYVEGTRRVEAAVVIAP